MKGTSGFKRYMALGVAAAAPVLGFGCGSQTNPCAAPADCGVTVTRTAIKGKTPIAIIAVPKTDCTTGAITYPVADSGCAPAGSITYKPIPSRTIAAAMANIEGGIPTADATPGANTTADCAPGQTNTVATIAGKPVVATGGRTVVTKGRPAVAGQQQRQSRVAAPAGTPVYITPGGTPVTAYVPAPASGTYLEDATPAGYQPVAEERGPDGTVVHYATRSICKYDPAKGEDCVWASGF